MLSNHPLGRYNTFGINAVARRFTIARSIEDLEEILKNHDPEDLLVIGGGSNLLLTTNVIEKTVVLIDLKGIEFREESDKHVRVKAMAGENWHDFVQNCVQHDYGGLENLSLIPGKVGAAPIQNIGAYGVELKDRFVSCSAIDRKTLEHKSFTREACEFGYRDSFFKKAGKDRYIITSVTFRLTRKEH